MSKTAIVVGGTGLVGAALLEGLIQSEYFAHIRCISRRPPPLSDKKLQYFKVDFERLDAAPEAFRGDCLFSALGTTRKQAGSVAAQRRVDLDYQLQAAKLGAMQGVDHYLLVSAMGANSNSASAYMQMKGELEERVAELAFSRTSIFQPSLLTGNREQQRLAESLAAPLLGGLCSLPGLKRYRPIAGAELAQAMIECSQSSGTGLEHFSLDACFPKR